MQEPRRDQDGGSDRRRQRHRQCQMNNLLRQLQGGDRRSIGAVPLVVQQVLANLRLFPIVFAGIGDADPLVSMRCADAVEKITAARPELLAAHKRQLIALARSAAQKEVRWHLAQLLSRVALGKSERKRVVEILDGYLMDPSRIVKTFAMQALADIAVQDSELRSPIMERLKRLTRTGSPAMKSRGRKLLARLSEPRGGLTGQ